MTDTAGAPEGRRYTTDAQLADWLGFHPANTREKRNGHDFARALFFGVALELNDMLPEGPEKTVALRAVKDALMQVNACLAIGGGPLERSNTGERMADVMADWQQGEPIHAYSGVVVAHGYENEEQA